MSRSLVREDHVLRYRLYVCTESAKFDAFKIELLSDQDLVHNGQLVNEAPIQDLWAEVLTALQHMRGQYDARPLYHPSIFAPWANIVAVEFARESAKTGLRVNEIVGGCHDEGHPLHDERVRALCKALDQVEFLQRRSQVH